jgi:hypothetical protein
MNKLLTAIPLKGLPAAVPIQSRRNSDEPFRMRLPIWSWLIAIPTRMSNPQPSVGAAISRDNDNGDVRCNEQRLFKA